MKTLIDMRAVLLKHKEEILNEVYEIMIDGYAPDTEHQVNEMIFDARNNHLFADSYDVKILNTETRKEIYTFDIFDTKNDFVEIINKLVGEYNEAMAKAFVKVLNQEVGKDIYEVKSF